MYDNLELGPLELDKRIMSVEHQHGRAIHVAVSQEAKVVLHRRLEGQGGHNDGERQVRLSFELYSKPATRLRSHTIVGAHGAIISMYWRMRITRKYMLAAFENCSKRFLGRNVNTLYFVVLTTFETKSCRWNSPAAPLSTCPCSPPPPLGKGSVDGATQGVTARFFFVTGAPERTMTEQNSKTIFNAFQKASVVVDELIPLKMCVLFMGTN